MIYDVIIYDKETSYPERHHQIFLSLLLFQHTDMFYAALYPLALYIL